MLLPLSVMLHTFPRDGAATASLARTWVRWAVGGLVLLGTSSAQAAPACRGTGCEIVTAIGLDRSPSGRYDATTLCGAAQRFLADLWRSRQPNAVEIVIFATGTKNAPEPIVVVPWTRIERGRGGFAPDAARRSERAAIDAVGKRCLAMQMGDASPIAEMVRKVHMDAVARAKSLSRDGVNLATPILLIASDGHETADKGVIAIQLGKKTKPPVAVDVSQLDVEWCGLAETTEQVLPHLQDGLRAIFTGRNIQFAASCAR